MRATGQKSFRDFSDGAGQKSLQSIGTKRQMGKKCCWTQFLSSCPLISFSFGSSCINQCKGQVMSHTDNCKKIKNYVCSLEDAIQTVNSKALFLFLIYTLLILVIKCLHQSQRRSKLENDCFGERITDDKLDHVNWSPPIMKGVYCMFCRLRKWFQKMQFILSVCRNDTPLSQSWAWSGLRNDIPDWPDISNKLDMTKLVKLCGETFPRV